MVKYLPFDISDWQGWEDTDASVQASIIADDPTYNAIKYSNRTIQKVDGTQVAMPFIMEGVRHSAPALAGLTEEQRNSLIEIYPDSTEWTTVDV